MINGNQFTIVCYVNENNLSHADPTVVTDIPEQFNTHFGDIIITRGKNILSLELISPYTIIIILR